MVEKSLDMLKRPSTYQQTPIQESIPEQESVSQEIIKNEPKKEMSIDQLKTPTTFQGKPDSEQEESDFGYIARQVAMNSSRVGEQVLGRWGNIEKFAKDTLKNNPLVAGPVGWAISELLGEDKWERLVAGPKGNQQILPTSKDLKQLSESATGGYTKAKTSGEEKFQEKIEDIASTVTGKTLRNPTPRNIALNNIVTPVAAGVVKDIVKDVGFGDDKANMAKLAVWLPLSLAFNVNAPQYAAELMNQGRRGFGNNIRVNVPRYDNSIAHTSRQFLQSDPRSQLAQQQVAGIYNDIANGQTSMPDLMRRYDAINAAKRDRGLFALNPGDRKAAIHNINLVRDSVRTEIETLGRSNPQALQSWQNGVNAFATIHRSNAITNWIDSVSKGPYAKILTGPAAGLFGIGSISGVKGPLVAGPATAGLSASYKTGQTLYRMWNDPNLNNYYWRSISAAQAQNLPAFINNYNKLNKELDKSVPTTPKTGTKK